MQAEDKPPPLTNELVIIGNRISGYQFNNRWLSSATFVVDYDSIECWTDNRLQMNNSHLKRIKIYGLPGKQISKLLRTLNSSTQLLQLEIDQLELQEGSRPEYFFGALKLLAIDAISVVDRQGLPPAGREMSPPKSAVKLNARQLKKVHLGSRHSGSLLRQAILTDLSPFSSPKGSDSIRYVWFSNPAEIQHLEIDQDPSGKLLRFKHLQVLICNEIRKIDLNIIDKFIRREVGQLNELHCNLAKLTSPSYRPTTEDLQHLKLLFQTFERYRHPRDLRTFHHDIRIRVYVNLYLQGVKVRFEKPFERYRFGDSLLEVHQHNFLNNKLTLATCRSVWYIDYRPGVVYSQFFDGDLPNLYPNIQCVALTRKPNETCPPRAFFLFIESCLALRELKLNGAGFDEVFYIELSRLQSVRTLSAFYLVEDVKFSERFDFDFLQNFRHLKVFGTNLAVRSVMIKLIERMPPLVSLDFQFMKPSVNFFCECIVEKKSAVELELLLGQRDSTDPPNNAKATAIRVIMDWQKASFYLSSEMFSPFLHWLDDLP